MTSTLSFSQFLISRTSVHINDKENQTYTLSVLFSSCFLNIFDTILLYLKGKYTFRIELVLTCKVNHMSNIK